MVELSCTIAKGAIVGMGAVLQDFCSVGAEAMIAAGSVIPANMQILPRHLAAGVPAEIKKEITGAFLVWINTSAPVYSELAGRYLEQGLNKI